MQRSAARQAFADYLRSWRRHALGASAGDSATLKTKFNPYHDPRNGRFTFGPDRQALGTAGPAHGTAAGSLVAAVVPSAGGSIRNVGQPSSARMPGPIQGRREGLDDAPALDLAAPSLAAQPQDRVVVRNGYSYRLDAADRTTSVTGTLTLTPDQQRSRSAQAAAGGRDRLPTDDGGHYIAAWFNGPTDTYNHFQVVYPPLP